MNKCVAFRLSIVLSMSMTIGNRVSAQTITSFSPASGAIGSTVTITGTNFSATPANNIVYFGATRATVTSASATQLEVTVPAGATYQAISVLVNGLTAYSGAPFITKFPGGGGITTTSFHPTKIGLPAGSWPGQMAIGDLDGDGKPDLVIIALDGGNHSKISVLRNTGTTGEITASSFSSRVDFEIGPFPVNLAIGDLDGDGKPELVVVGVSVAGFGGINAFSIFKNTCTVGTINASSFAPRVDFVTNDYPAHVAMSDLDGDGKPDLVITNERYANTVSIFRNITNTGVISESSFSAGVDFSLVYGRKDVSIGDLDGDGKPDLAITAMDAIINGSAQDGNRVSILKNTSTPGTISTDSFAPKVDFATNAEPSDVDIDDLDDDGKPELVVVSKNSVSIFRNTSNPGTITGSSFADKVDFYAFSATEAEICDLDGDGKPDLTVNGYASWVSLFKNVASAGTITPNSFATHVDLARKPNYGLAIVTGDLDGNGKPEIVVSDGDAISILQNLIPRLAITSFSPTVGPIGTSVTINGIAFDPITTNNTVTFNGIASTVTVSSTSSITSSIPVGATSGPVAVMVGDSITTSLSNFIVTNIASFSPASGTFGTIVTITGTDFDPIPANNIVAFNGTPATVTASTTTALTTTVPNGATSGRITLAANGTTSSSEYDFTITPPPIASFSPPSGPIGTTVLIAGTLFDPIPGNNIVLFGSARATVTEATPTQLTVTVPAGAITGPISVIVNGLRATSTLPFVVTFSDRETVFSTGYSGQADFLDALSPLSDLPPTFVVEDFDGDSKPDLLMPGMKLSVRENTTTPGPITSTAFANPVDFPGGLVAMGDLDGDGKPEVVLVHDDTVSVCKNNATPGTIKASSLSERIDFVRGRRFLDYILGLAIADMDGDGKQDLIFLINDTERETFKVSIWRNTLSPGGITTSSFAAGVDFQINGHPTDLSISDLDGDGNPDLVIFGGMLAIVKNASSPGQITETSFEHQVDFAKAGLAQSIAIGDLDRDGKPDLVASSIDPSNTADYHKHTVSVHQNKSTKGEITTSSLIKKVTFTTDWLPDINHSRQVAIGDLDGDGRPELVIVGSHEVRLPFTCKGYDFFHPCTGEFLDYTVSGFKNNSKVGEIGTNSFGSQADFIELVSNSPHSIEINDFDGDGRTEILVSTHNYFSILSVCSPPAKPTITITGSGTPPYGGPVLTSSPGDTYLWYWNGTPYYGQSLSASLPTIAIGEYKVRVKVNSCFSDFSDPVQLVTGTTSTNEPELSVYPIPAHEQLIVKGVSLSSGHWSVMNVLGRESQPPVQLSEEGALIDIRDLVSGVYILRINDGIKPARIKFIKE